MRREKDGAPGTVRAAALAAIAVLLATGSAVAGCPNVCELEADRPALEPASDCLELEAVAETCDCGVELTLYNRCEVGVEPVGFVFDKCWTSQTDTDTFVFDCALLEPDRGAQVKLRLNETGAATISREVQAGDVRHTISVPVDVKSLDSEGGCALAAGHRGSPFGFVVSAVLVALALGRRRRLG